VCVRARAWVGGVTGRACVRVALLIQHAKLVRHNVTSFVAPLAPLLISTLSHNRDDFQEKGTYTKHLLIFSTTLV
jgi:hypothetical protein